MQNTGHSVFLTLSNSSSMIYYKVIQPVQKVNHTLEE